VVLFFVTEEIFILKKTDNEQLSSRERARDVARFTHQEQVSAELNEQREESGETAPTK